MSPPRTAGRSPASPPLGQGEGLLAADEPPPFEQVNASGRCSTLLVCDHACNRIPRSLANLGLQAEQRARHIAWDAGAAEVARGLGARLDATLVLGNWSRLVIDLNRSPASPESIPEISDNLRIPGNQGLTAADRARRLSALFQPYHGAIAALLQARAALPIQLIGIHSFTPRLGGQLRPWHIGIACGADRRLADPLIRALRRHRDLQVGDNRPYDIDHEIDYTLPTHARNRGIPHVMIEIRQDQLLSAADIDAWVVRLADAIRCASAVNTGFLPRSHGK